ncbi:MAG: radical SAM protein [Clostridia bacterium]|nr:radical SAM protein [Clostridia bacterium]
MNFTLYLTDDCNFNCKYCSEMHGKNYMSEEVAVKAADLARSLSKSSAGFSFFGGEPLLCRDIIETAVKRLGGDGLFTSFKLTTNGLLLDEEFLIFAQENNIEIALSHDGISQDKNRVDRAGEGTLAQLESKIDLLLSYQSNAVAMQTVTPQTVGEMASSVDWLYKRGFSRINTAIDCRPQADWDEDGLNLLQREYEKVSYLCADYALSSRPLNYLNFSSKILAYLYDRPCLQCDFAIKQPCIAFDGYIYPCKSFIRDASYRIGNVQNGLNYKKQAELSQYSKLPQSCTDCALNTRCRCTCPCLNYTQTGNLNEVSAVQCAHEQMTIKIADNLASVLYRHDPNLPLKVCGRG